MTESIFTLQALGTSWWVEIFDELNNKKRQTIYSSLMLFITEFENKYSRFKADSLISILNKEGRLHQPPADFLSMLKTSFTLYDTTEGIFNIMVGTTLIDTGYDANYSFVIKKEQSQIPNPNDVITVTDSAVILKEGVIDLGGIGKGYLIDALASLLKEQFGVLYFLINGGGDMFGTSEQGKPITLYLEHPTKVETYLGTVDIFNQGFAASSPHKRSWKSAGKHYSHIISTHSSETVEKPDATFVLAESATTADTLATTLLLTTQQQTTTLSCMYHIGVARFFLPDNLQSNNLFILQNN